MTESSQPSTPVAPPTPPVTALLQKQFGDRVTDAHNQHGDETVTIRREGMLEVFQFLRDDAVCAFEMMVDLTAVDYLPRTPRFEVVVHLKSLTKHHRLRVKIPVEESAPEVDSIHGIWGAANWYERECREMYGIEFKGHPNPDFLLLYEGFQGHPLRKDYQKEIMQPLVPMRPVKERHDYGEIFRPVATDLETAAPAEQTAPQETPAASDAPTAQE